METKQPKKGRALDIFRSPYARKFFSKYKWSYLIGVAVLILIDVLQTEVPLVVGETIDRVAERGFTADMIWQPVYKLAFIAVVVFLGRIIWRWFIFGSARKIERDMRNELYAHLQTLSASYFHKHKAGEIMAYISSDIEAVRMVFAVTIMMGIDSLAIGLSTLYKMVTQIDPVLTVMAFLPMVLVALTTTFVGGELHRRFKIRQQAFSDLSDFVNEKLGGMKVIKAFVQEPAERENFETVNKIACDANVKEARIQAFMFPFMRAVTGLSMALAIGYGGYIAIQGRISAGNFGSFIMFLNNLMFPMAAIGRIINVLTRGGAAMQRLENVLHAQPDIKDWPEARDEGPVMGSIEARNLTFRYPTREKPVLENVSFKLEKGQTLGVVGRTGCGKSSLVNLLMRVFDPEEGQLFVGGREIHSIPLKQLRETCGYVPQDNFLFSDTITENIRFGDRSKTQEDIENAARAACVHDNIVDFAEGYNTMVGERGVSLSGGQKQRIAIARALILDPEILILDDSVSAVDTDTEEKILAHLRETRRGKTNVIIAHRISTIQNADKIIVIDEGRLAEMGTHEELVALGGIYADMYNRQLLEKMKKEEYAL
ncbi:MAG: ABC transporter ATP-binding protein [Clostridia bacterium]|nr:ABC transporter ATP-binding protein [Clostridia bacterium]